MSKEIPHIFWKSLISLAFACFLILKILYNEEKPKSEWMHARRKILSISTTWRDQPYRDSGSYRYIVLHNFDKPIEIFTGKGKYDFKAQLEIVDSLKAGDWIDVYYDDVYKEDEQPVRRSVYSIEKDKKRYFLDGNSKKPLANGLMGFLALIFACLLYLKKAEKIA